MQLFNGERRVFKRKLKPVKSLLLIFSIISKRKNAQAKYLGLWETFVSGVQMTLLIRHVTAAMGRRKLKEVTLTESSDWINTIKPLMYGMMKLIVTMPTGHLTGIEVLYPDNLKLRLHMSWWNLHNQNYTSKWWFFFFFFCHVQLANDAFFFWLWFGKKKLII